MQRLRRGPPGGIEPLSPRKKWRAITIATLALVPSYWSIMVGLVAVATETEGPSAGPFIALGLALIPFVFIVLAFLSEHPRAAGAVVKAMGLTLLVGIIVSAIAVDAVTGLVAGIGAGGIVALRADLERVWKARALAVLAVTAYAFVMVRVAGDVTLLLAPTLPFTCLGVADHLAEQRRERRAEA